MPSQEYRVTRDNVEMPLRDYIAMVVANEVGAVREDVHELDIKFDALDRNFREHAKPPASPSDTVSKNTSFRLQAKGALNVIVHLITWTLAVATLIAKFHH